MSDFASDFIWNAEQAESALEERRDRADERLQARQDLEQYGALSQKSSEYAFKFCAAAVLDRRLHTTNQEG